MNLPTITLQDQTHNLNQTQNPYPAQAQNNNVRKIVLFCAAVLLVLGVVFAYMWATHEIEVENILQSRTVDVVINEEFDELIVAAGATVTKEVSFENTGSAAVFLRFTYAQYWETADELLEGYTDSVTLDWVNGSFWDNWYDGGDGWYYYKSVLAAGDSVDILSSVTFSEDIPEAYYNLFFQVETVQVSDESSVNTSVTETLFGITGTLSSPTISNGAVTSASVEWSVISDEA